MKAIKSLAALAILTLILMSGTTISNAFAETYTVGKSGSGEYGTISEAFAALKYATEGSIAGKGDYVIEVQDAEVYYESVVLEGLVTTASDTLTLRGIPEPNSRPIIDATNQSGEAIRITTVAWMTIEGFELKTKQNAGNEEYRVLWADQADD